MPLSHKEEVNWEVFICRGAHCKCMNLDGKCKNYHKGDHTCPNSTPTPVSHKESKTYGAVINGRPVKVAILKKGRFFTLVSYKYSTYYADYNRTIKGLKAKWILTSKLTEVESKTFKEISKDAESNLDQRLSQIINHAIVRDGKEENPLAVEEEAIKAIKQAISEHVIGKDVEPGTPWDNQWEGRRAINIILEEQRKALYNTEETMK